MNTATAATAEASAGKASRRGIRRRQPAGAGVSPNQAGEPPPKGEPQDPLGAVPADEGS